MLQKDEAEHPVPVPLRATLSQITDALAAGDFALQKHRIAHVRPISDDTAAWIAGNVAAYGATLAPLCDQTWDRAVYSWQGDHWGLIVDLATTSEPVSDLALHAKLHEVEDTWEVELYGVYVP